VKIGELMSSRSEKKYSWEPNIEQDEDRIWDEYKYRHDLCWRLVFQLTTAVVIISVVPYIKPDVAKQLGSIIAVLPIIGIALTLLGYARLNREFALLDAIRGKHRELQGLLGPEDDAETKFSKHAKFYLWCLLGLGFVDVVVVVWFVGLPGWLLGS
jgi:hypothetical protein